MTARLPQEKISLYASKLSGLMRSRTVKLKKIQSVIGCLQFATSIILPGKAFTRRLIDTTIGVTKPFHCVTVNVETRSDIRMWYLFSNTTMEKLCFYKPQNILRCHSTCSRMQVKWHVPPLLVTKLVRHWVSGWLENNKFSFPWFYQSTSPFRFLESRWQINMSISALTTKQLYAS